VPSNSLFWLIFKKRGNRKLIPLCLSANLTPALCTGLEGRLCSSYLPHLMGLKPNGTRLSRPYIRIGVVYDLPPAAAAGAAAAAVPRAAAGGAAGAAAAVSALVLYAGKKVLGLKCAPPDRRLHQYTFLTLFLSLLLFHLVLSLAASPSPNGGGLVRKRENATKRGSKGNLIT